MSRTIIHVDMDAFYAAVEVRDNPELAGKPLIIGALPEERGVVATCSYEARKYGVRSAMSINEAYRRCPAGIYMHPDIPKYKAVSAVLHEIWNSFTDIVEYVSLDEGYLDVTGSLFQFGSARSIAQQIKEQTLARTGLTCSVGIGYSMSSAKLASEEKKPNGLFEVPDCKFYQSLIIDRDIRVLPGIGEKTAEKLRLRGINTVRDVLSSEKQVSAMFGKHGGQIVERAHGIDSREVIPWHSSERKSVGKERTFQQDTEDFAYLKNVLRLLAKELSMKMRLSGMYAQTITLKVTYGNMKALTRAKSGDGTNSAREIYESAAMLLEGVEKKPIRLVGITLSGLTENAFRQLSLEDLKDAEAQKRKDGLDEKLLNLQKKYGSGIIKTAVELEAEKQVRAEGEE